MAHILIAEDDAAIRHFVERALESQGHTVTLCADGGEALETLENRCFDLLLTDIMMPVMDGIALSLAASSHHPNMPIVMMTGYSGQKERAHNLDALIRDVLLKPFTMDQLRQSVGAALLPT